jgi:putative hydrolase of the HAD superfamily
MFTALVFDLDDTLYPEREYAFSGYAAVARAFADVLGEPLQSAAEMQSLFDGPDRPRVFNALLARRGMAEDPALIQRMIHAYRTHAPTIRLFSDADAALNRLRANFRLGLITDGPAVQQWAKIDALALRPRFDQIIVTSECEPGLERAGEAAGASYAKPHPYAFEWISARLSARPQDCVYLADNPAKDFVAPNRLGWLTVRIVRPGGIYCEAGCAEGGRPHREISSLDELPGCLYR